MNSRLASSAFGLLAPLVLASYACAPASDGGTLPTPGATGGSAPGTAGDTSMSGSSGSSVGGSSTGTSGSSTGTSGSTGTGGGTTETGGTGGTGTGGSGESGGTGTGGSGGAPVGTGGSAGAPAGGSGGAAGGSAGGAITIAQLFPEGPDGSLDGMLSLAPCKEKNTSGTDCTPIAYYKGKASDCANGALNIEKTFNVGGTPGTMYKATLHFYGVAEPKVYGTGVTREAPNRPQVSPANGNGGVPTPWASAPGGYMYPASDYNTYEIRVSDNTGKETNVYFLNADTSQGHWVYVINYEKTIPVIGGGKVKYRTYDRNCRQIKNCGYNKPNNECAKEANDRKIDVSQVVPPPTAMNAAQGGLLQPQLTADSDAGNAGQWLLIDVTAVAPM